MYSYSKFLATCILFAIFLNVNGQEGISLIGKVENPENEIANILIINLNSNKATITDDNGNFIIDAQLTDTIQLRAFQFISKKILINDSISRKGSITVQLIENVIALDEVTIAPYNLSGNLTKDIENIQTKPIITALSLGLIDADIKKLTKSERLLAESNSGKWIYFFQKDSMDFYRPTLIINLHKIINRVSGRTQNMRDRVASDKELIITEEIINTFSEETLSEAFNIPKEKIKLFLIYCQAQSDFSKLSENTNPFRTWKYFKTKSIIYSKLLENEYVENITKNKV